jgi:hypothetical protein
MRSTSHVSCACHVTRHKFLQALIALHVLISWSAMQRSAGSAESGSVGEHLLSLNLVLELLCLVAQTAVFISKCLQLLVCILGRLSVSLCLSPPVLSLQHTALTVSRVQPDSMSLTMASQQAFGSMGQPPRTLCVAHQFIHHTSPHTALLLDHCGCSEHCVLAAVNAEETQHALNNEVEHCKLKQ